jgi:hypothetical protein
MRSQYRRRHISVNSWFIRGAQLLSAERICPILTHVLVCVVMVAAHIFVDGACHRRQTKKTVIRMLWDVPSISNLVNCIRPARIQPYGGA